MPYDEQLVQRIRSALEGEPDISERKMFGGIAFMVGTSMFVGVSNNDLMARVGADNHDDALARKGARPMDFTGRPVRGFLYVGPDGLAADADLRRWIDECLAFARSLPAKPPGASRPRPRVRRA